MKPEHTVRFVICGTHEVPIFLVGFAVRVYVQTEDKEGACIVTSKREIIYIQSVNFGHQPMIKLLVCWPLLKLIDET